MRNQAKIDFLKWQKIYKCYTPPTNYRYSWVQEQVMNNIIEKDVEFKMIYPRFPLDNSKE